MTTPSLVIDGITLSIVSFLNFDQSIEPIGGNTMRRMSNGAALKISHWRKYRVTFSASGWFPATLMGVDYETPFEIELPLPIALKAGESLPSGWTQRSGAWAEVSKTDQDGVTVRVVYVKMTVIAEPPTQRHGFDGTPSWDLICEQV